MMRALLLTVLLGVSGLSVAKEVSGIKVPEAVDIDGKALKLNGAGIRKKLIFKVYVAGLYVETLTSDAAKILSVDQVRRVEMTMLRNLDKKAIVEAIRNGFEKNNADKMPALKERLEKFVEAVPDLKEGQVLELTYVPTKGTKLRALGKEYVVEGKDFADALFSVWLGEHPVDSGLKEALLGQ